MPRQTIPRCQIVPLPGDQIAFEVDGQEKTRWHFSPSAPRPFFYPVLGPSGRSVTRMGHPGAQNHDHHRSVWFAHHKVLGMDFWSDQTEARIRQSLWLAYEDGDEEAIMATRLQWLDGHDPRPLIEQELVVAVRPLDDQQWQLELQATFRPNSAMLEFGKTNFGFLAVRVAKGISACFGEGRITDSEERRDEPAIFGKSARWVDYTGHSPFGDVEGITYFDHPGNRGYPNKWHVREDGWMGASICMDEPLLTTQAEPLRLRFLLLIHGSRPKQDELNAMADDFASRPGFGVEKSTKKHRQYTVARTA